MPNLDVQDAIKKARSYVAEIFKDEPIADIGLEEVEHDVEGWKITIGFNRIWKIQPSGLAGMLSASSFQRSFKVVTISDADGTLVSIKNREPATANN
jgi:hypothetical protein